MELFHCLVTGLLGVNTYIIPLGDGDAFVIDAGGNADDIGSFLDSHSLFLRSLVLTHGHFDHMGAVAELKAKYPEAALCIHQADRRYIGNAARKNHLADFGNSFIEQFVLKSVSSVPEPDTLLSDGDILFEDSPFFKGGFAVIHTPGHSSGSICLYNAAQKVLFSGDTLFDGTWGRTDLPGGDSGLMSESLRKLFTLPGDTAVLPGHGNSTVISSVQEILQY